MDRRNFLKVLGISSGTALISSCGVDKANEKIIPYVIPPEVEIYRGKAIYYNTTCTECPANCGLSVTVNEKVYHEQRSLFPTKLEGIPGHPVNDGALCMRGQSGLFRLYHPERIQRPMVRDASGNLRVATWKEAFEKIKESLNRFRSKGRKNYYFSGKTSGSLSELIDSFCQEMNVERLPEFEVYSHANIRRANELVFGRAELPAYRIEKADFLLSFGADLFETFVSPVSFAVQFGKARKKDRWNWYHFEPHVSLTGAQATQRVVLKPGTEAAVLAFLIHSAVKQNRVKRQPGSDILAAIPDYSAAEVARISGVSAEQLQQIAVQFAAAENPLAVSGGVSTANQSGLETAVLTALLQYSMGMTDTTVDFSRAADFGKVGDRRDLARFGEQLTAGKVGVLFLSKSDPVHVLPAESEFARNLPKAGLRVGLSDVMNETVKQCDVILPLSHSLESWGDAEPHKGVRTAIQPAIEPQYDTLGEGDVLLRLMAPDSGGREVQSYKNYLFAKWKRKYGEAGSKALQQHGFLEEQTTPVRTSLKKSAVLKFFTGAQFHSPVKTPLLVVAPSIRSYDGRSKDLPLLNELPDPLSTITYGKWVFVSQVTAEKMHLQDRDEVELSAGSFCETLAVKVQPLLQEDVYVVQRGVITPPLTGSDPRSGELSWLVDGISVRKTGKRVALPVLAGSENEEGRGLLPHEDEHHHGAGEEAERIYPKHEHKIYRWGMAIDLDSCIGCNACAAACYVENNVPIVGEEEHLKGREMSWIRIQPYFNENETAVEFVPMMCQQCDDAPCESVCPVYAAYHNPEGLNVQVYNRCVGTRYCSNNCPYKVRRFNWFDHSLPEPLDKMYNPDISVRGRGVMEKCTFCIQRIRQAKDTAKDENRIVQDGEVTPACAQTCPTNAITFGNLKDESSAVYKLAHSESAYRALEELGTEPGVYYLKKKG